MSSNHSEPLIGGAPSARRALDAEGWDSDVALLRKQLAAAERRLLQTRLAARLDGAPTVSMASCRPLTLQLCASRTGAQL